MTFSCRFAAIDLLHVVSCAITLSSMQVQLIKLTSKKDDITVLLMK